MTDWIFSGHNTALAPTRINERWDEIRPYTALDNEMFFDVLNFCLKNGYCQYEGKIYTQIEGIAMGNPLSPAIAEI